MSKETYKAVEDALTAHFSDEMDGSMMTAFVCQMQGIPMDEDKSGYSTLYRVVPKGQAITTTLGLIEYVGIAMRENVKESFDS